MTESLEKGGTTSALFITLKGGVAFTARRGSFVLGGAATDSLLARIQRPSSTPSPPPSPDEPWRPRLLGIHDMESGTPIANVEVLASTIVYYLTYTPGGVLLR